MQREDGMADPRPIREIMEALADDHEKLHKLGSTIQEAVSYTHLTLPTTPYV